MLLLPLVSHSWMPLLSPYPSFLSVSIRNPNNGGDIPMITNRKTKRRSKNLDSRLKISGMTEKDVVTPAIFKPFLACPWMYLSGIQKYLKTFECLIKDFRHDERGGFPPEFQAWRERKPSTLFLSLTLRGWGWFTQFRHRQHIIGPGKPE